MLFFFVLIIFTRKKRLFASSYPSIRPSLSALTTFISTAFIGQISVKFDIGDFFENLSIKSKRG